jgi:hypothetical protein
MSLGRFSFWSVVGLLAVMGLTACEPYMSMTDRIPAQTRRAATLLPHNPRYVGMLEVAPMLREVQALRGESLVDSLQQTDNPYVRRFLDATGIDLTADVKALYGAFEGDESFSAVLFGNLTPEQMDRYLQRAPAGAGRATSYRDVPLYHLTLADGPVGDTLTVAFVGSGTMALSMRADRVTAMVDRSIEDEGGLAANDTYMTLVKRVGRGSTAWLAGRDVLQTALRDEAPAARRDAAEEGPADEQTAEERTAEEGTDAETVPDVTQAGVQRALSEWSDRVLGLSKVSSLDGRAGRKVKQLRRRLREQAVSLTLTDAGLEGEVYLTMRDEASASSVVDVAEGLVAMLKLSGDDLDARHRDLLDEVAVDRDGPIVHVQFALDRSTLRSELRCEPAARRAPPSSSSGAFVDSSVRSGDSSI